MPARRGSTAAGTSTPGGGVQEAKCEAVAAAAEGMPLSVEYLRASLWVRYIEEVTVYLESESGKAPRVVSGVYVRRRQKWRQLIMAGPLRSFNYSRRARLFTHIQTLYTNIALQILFD
ncbi:hypothetical protein JCGZ_06907 [Jatropha curcas]|uniref:Uncharacterized protein n=1 Tax=Jatropha curcas TaxID=180498 RepID=A0A067KMV6_JATCU|nr:hypothetical protein JCGZ_06907 [Jatropha curcas]